MRKIKWSRKFGKVEIYLNIRLTKKRLIFKFLFQKQKYKKVGINLYKGLDEDCQYGVYVSSGF